MFMAVVTNTWPTAGGLFPLAGKLIALTEGREESDLVGSTSAVRLGAFSEKRLRRCHKNLLSLFDGTAGEKAPGLKASLRAR